MAFTINIGGSQINLILIFKKTINKIKYVMNLANITYANKDPCHLAFYVDLKSTGQLIITEIFKILQFLGRIFIALKKNIFL